MRSKVLNISRGNSFITVLYIVKNHDEMMSMQPQLLYENIKNNYVAIQLIVKDIYLKEYYELDLNCVQYD